MALPKFIYGGTSGVQTPEELARLRAVAEMLAAPRAPKNVGEGLSAIGDALGYRLTEGKADKLQAYGNEQAQSAIAKALGGAGAFPAAPASSSGVQSAPVASLVERGDAAASSNPVGMQPGQSSGPAFAGVTKAGAGWTEVQTADGQTVRREGARNWRNNNPGNIEYGPLAKSMGAVGSDGRFAVFPTLDAGRAAKEKLLFDGPGYRGKTLAGAISRWAPPSENNTSAYIGAMASAAGVSADTPLSAFTPEQRSRALAAMERIEGFKQGREVPVGGGRPVQVASLDPSVGMPPAPSDPLAAMAPGTTAPAYDPSGLPPLDPNDPMSPVAAALSSKGAVPGPNAIASALRGPPQPGATPGAPAISAAGQRLLVNPHSITGGPPMPIMGQPPQAVSQQAQAAPPQQPAQNLDQIPVEAGGNAGAIKQGQLPSMQQLMEASQNPWLNDQQRGVINMLMKQQLDAQDPNNALDAEYKRAQIDALKARPDQTPESVRALQMRAQAAGLVPGSPEYSDFMVTGGNKGTTVNVDTKGETEYDKALGKNLADKTVGIMDAGQQATNKIATYQQMMDVLPNVYTGAGGDTMLTLKRAAKGLGIDTGDLSGPEFVQAMGNQMALELRNPAGGAGMPGAMSDSDRAFLSSMSPGLTKTPEGNKKLLEYRMTLEKRNIEVAQKAGEYMQTHNGRLDNGFFTDLSKWSADNPLFPKAEKKPTVIDGYTIEPVE